MALNALLAQYTLMELAKRTNNGNLVAIAEVLNATNEFIQDAVWLEANSTTGHKTTVRTSLPTGTWRKFNKGVSVEASSTKQVVETIGMLESYSQVDKDLVDLDANPAAKRAQEDAAFIEGLGQTFASAFLYANTATDPEQFMGLSPRVTSKTATNAIDGGGGGSDCTSIWVVQWGPGRVHLVYPKGSQSGLEFRDLGEVTATDSDAKLYQAYRSFFAIKPGLVVGDDRCIQRYCNIETSGSSNIFSAEKLIELLNRLPFNAAGAAIYCNNTIKTQMDKAALSQSNAIFQPGQIGGVPVTMFRGVPVRRMDAALSTETALS